MTKKQQEIQLMLPLIQGKEVRIWTNGQLSTKEGRKLSREPFFEGTVDRFTGLYLVLKNVIFWNGRFFADYDINAGTIGRIELKQKAN